MLKAQPPFAVSTIASSVELASSKAMKHRVPTLPTPTTLKAVSTILITTQQLTTIYFDTSDILKPSFFQVDFLTLGLSLSQHCSQEHRLDEPSMADY